MEIFVSKINERFTIKQISEILKKPYPLVHRSIKLLIDTKFVIKDKQGFLSLNYRENHLELAYVESIRKKEFLKNKTISLFVKDVLEKINLDFFIFLIFGSFVENKKKPRDIDILLIIEDKNKINNIEKILHNLASNFTLKFDINIISVESIYEMLAKREEVNIMNETLDNHILFFGAENYYRLLKNVR
jgi:predicted nucleotidyltransferase